MERIAILVGSANTAQNRLQGVVPDVFNMQNYLMSPIGGSFDPNEILILEDETFEMVRTVIDNYSNFDYVMVYFSGHGYTSDSRNARMVHFADKSVSDLFLIPNAKVNVVVVDTCRTFFEPLHRYTTINGIRDIELYSAHEVAREQFDSIIEESQPGTVIIHGTQFGNVAFDSQLGGHFTYTFLETLYDLYATDEANFVLIDDALMHTNTRLKAGGSLQQGTVVFREGAALIPVAVNIPIHAQ